MAEASGGIMDGLTGMLNVFVDPGITAQKAPAKMSWVWPIAVLVIGYMVFGYLMMPYFLQAGEADLAKRNVPAESMARAQSMTQTIAKVSVVLVPVFVIGFIALFAALIRLAYTMMDARPRFHDVFSLLASCSLIAFLQYAAGYFVLHLKGDPVESREQLQPPFGLDIFFPNLHGPSHAILAFFSIFMIWYMVVLVFGLAALTRSSKTKALIAITPAWVLPLLMRILGSFFESRAG